MGELSGLDQMNIILRDLIKRALLLIPEGKSKWWDDATAAMEMCADSDILRAPVGPAISGGEGEASDLYWHVRTPDELTSVSLPPLIDNMIFGWRTMAGKIYAGDGYPVPANKFMLDNQHCAEVMIRRHTHPTPASPEGGGEVERLREALTKIAKTRTPINSHGDTRTMTHDEAIRIARAALTHSTAGEGM